MIPKAITAGLPSHIVTLERVTHDQAKHAIHLAIEGGCHIRRFDFYTGSYDYIRCTKVEVNQYLQDTRYPELFVSTDSVGGVWLAEDHRSREFHVCEGCNVGLANDDWTHLDLHDRGGRTDSVEATMELLLSPAMATDETSDGYIDCYLCNETVALGYQWTAPFKE